MDVLYFHAFLHFFFTSRNKAYGYIQDKEGLWSHLILEPAKTRLRTTLLWSSLEQTDQFCSSRRLWCIVNTGTLGKWYICIPYPDPVYLLSPSPASHLLHSQIPFPIPHSVLHNPSVGIMPCLSTFSEWRNIHLKQHLSLKNTYYKGGVWSKTNGVGSCIQMLSPFCTSGEIVMRDKGCRKSTKSSLFSPALPAWPSILS